MAPPARRVAVVGLGSIGTRVATALDQGIDGLVLSAISIQDPAKHRGFLAGLQRPPPILPIDGLCDVADIVIECAPARLVRSIVAPFVSRGKIAIVLSAGALLENEDLIELAKRNGGQIVVPTGALIGLDAVTAAAEGNIQSVRMVTRKPVNGLAGAPYLVENNIDIADIVEPLMIFEGTARDAAKGFPANLNVAVALSLAGLGPDRTMLQIWADPTVTRNVHRVEVEFEFRAVLDVDREHSVGKSQDRPHHRALGDCLSAQAGCRALCRNLSSVVKSVRALTERMPRLRNTSCCDRLCNRRATWPGDAKSICFRIRSIWFRTMRSTPCPAEEFGGSISTCPTRILSNGRVAILRRPGWPKWQRPSERSAIRGKHGWGCTSDRSIAAIGPGQRALDRCSAPGHQR